MRKKIEDKWAEIVGLPVEQHVNVLGDKNRYIDTAIQAVIEEVEEIEVENPFTRMQVNPQWQRAIIDHTKEAIIKRIKEERDAKV